MLPENNLRDDAQTESMDSVLLEDTFSEPVPAENSSAARPGTKSFFDNTNLITVLGLGLVFVALTMMFAYCFIFEGKGTGENAFKFNDLANVYPLAIGMLLAGLTVFAIKRMMFPKPFFDIKRRSGWWLYPLIAGLLGFYCMLTAYLCMGIWPVGERSILTVDMHHQYAPLLAWLRGSMLQGDVSLYSFNVGLGTSVVPLFGYYLASPFNFLLALFPFSMLNEGLLLITLLKNAMCAFTFALCMQYMYRRRSPVVIFTAIMYSTMMFLIAYSWNIMWLDCLFMLPLIVMAFERMMREKKYILYIISLAYCLYSNYYIGFMICIFMVLYFLAYILRNSDGKQTVWCSFVRFAIGSAIAGGLAMFLVLPVYLSLGDTSASGNIIPEMNNYFDFFDLLERHLYDVSPTIRTGNLPNIYCGILSLVLLPIFATTKGISRRRRAAWLGLLGVLAISLVLNQPNLLWHGGHAPNDLPYRFSFAYSFVLIIIAAETLTRIRQVKPGQIGAAAVGLVAYLMIYEKIAGDSASFLTVYVSMLMVVVFSILLALCAFKRLSPRVVYGLIALAVIAEATLNAGGTFKTLHKNEVFTARSGYVANDTTKAISEAVSIAQGYDQHGFSRMEFTPRRTTVDPAMFGYNGVSVFASSNPKRVTTLMNRLGYANNGVNSYLYRSFVPTVDALFGIRYFINDGGEVTTQYLNKKSQSTVGSAKYVVYESNAVLPLAYFVDNDIKNWSSTRYNPIRTQNTLYSSMTGLPDELYIAGELRSASSPGCGSTSGDTRISLTLEGTSSTGYYEVEIMADGMALLYIDCGAAKSSSVSVGDISETPSMREPYMVNLGDRKVGDIVKVNITTESDCSGNIYLQTLDADAFERHLNVLRSGSMELVSFTDSKIVGKVDAPRDGVLLTSIPYDSGWTVKIDGKAVEPLRDAPKAEGSVADGNVMIDAMLAVEIPAGAHTVEFAFFPSGLLAGTGISAVSLVLMIALVVLRKRSAGNESDSVIDSILWG